jgi:8-hydroxy-5-deazaflavin:NADPH oxidoreductase
MRIGIIGAGHIGGNIARQAVRVGHEVVLSFSHDPANLLTFAKDLGELAVSGTPREAVQTVDLTVLSVPWSVIDLALDQAGPLDGRIVVDTTNRYGSGPGPAPGQTCASYNAARMPGARYTKCFNTLTSAFQAETAQRAGERRVVQWLCGDEEAAKQTVAEFVDRVGYIPVDLGGTADCHVMESPRRPGAVYGEEYRLADVAAVIEALRAGRPLPPAPEYA